MTLTFWGSRDVIGLMAIEHARILCY